MYLIFISYTSGQHYNCICHSANEVVNYFNQLNEEGEFNRAISIKEVDNIIDDYWIEDSKGNWATITTASDYSINQATEYFNQPTNAANKQFLVTDKTGHSNKPSKMDIQHLRSTWNIDETDDDDTQLSDYLIDAEIGDIWETNAIRIVCTDTI